MSPRISLIGDHRALLGHLAESCRAALPEFRVEEGVALEEDPPLAVIVLPDPPDDRGRFADRPLALPAAARSAPRVLLTSTEIYAADPHHPGRASEAQLTSRRQANRIASAWAKIERQAQQSAAEDGAPLVVLRSPWIAVDDDPVAGRGLFQGAFSFSLPGHDPTIQVLSVEDLAAAIAAAVRHGIAGTFNLAPRSPIPLRRALAISGVRRLPVPLLLQRLLGRSPDRLAYRRYVWTVSGEQARRTLDVEARQSSGEALLALRRRRGRRAGRREERLAARPYDDWGQDPDYIAKFRRFLFRFLHDFYWRIDCRGLEHVPASGKAILVGVHRGFMPWDGVMAMHQIAEATGRFARFLIHPGLIKSPFLANYMTKLGGVLACRENADALLERGELLGVFPEGIYGAFSLYRDAYRLKKFGRGEYIRLALCHQAPLVPFVTVGSAETFPILKRFDWAFWVRSTEWPFFPITPTFPLLPVPLPSKWHTRYLPPIDLAAEYPPEAADDPQLVRELGRRVESILQAELDTLVTRRRRIFYGALEGSG